MFHKGRKGRLHLAKVILPRANLVDTAGAFSILCSTKHWTKSSSTLLGYDAATSQAHHRSIIGPLQAYHRLLPSILPGLANNLLVPICISQWLKKGTLRVKWLSLWTQHNQPRVRNQHGYYNDGRYVRKPMTEVRHTKEHGSSWKRMDSLEPTNTTLPFLAFLLYRFWRENPWVPL